MLLGFALAQALPLLATPLLTRLFSPEAFGLQTLFVSSASVLLAFATLRLDLAAVLSADRREAVQIASLAALQTCLVAIVILIAAAIFGRGLAAATGHAHQVAWIWALAPMVMVLAVAQVGTGLLTWLKRFGPASQAQVVNQVGYLGAAIGLGSWAALSEGLVVAKLVGQAVAAAVLIYLLRGILKELRLPPTPDWPRLWARCRPFVIFNTPYSLVGVLGREVPIFAFSAVAATAAAGHYGLARMLLGAPATLLAASLSQVFYREAAEHRGTQRLQALTAALLGVTLRSTAPVLALIMVWGDTAFAIAFGEDWVTAGRYAMILALPAWLQIQTAWPERLYESVARQGVSFSIQLSFDLLAALCVFGAVLSGAPAYVAVITFATINSTFHLVYLVGMFRVAAFPLALLARALGGGVAVFGLSILLSGGLRLLPLSPLAALFCASVIALSACAVLGLRGYRSILAHTAAPA